MTYDERKLIKIDVHTTKSNLTPMELKPGPNVKNFLERNSTQRRKLRWQ